MCIGLDEKCKEKDYNNNIPNKIPQVRSWKKQKHDATF